MSAIQQGRFLRDIIDVVDGRSLVNNSSTLATNSASDVFAACTWSSTPVDRESYPLNCISWAAAREFCQAHDGDLPTEVQWEYAATAAGREFEATYPGTGDVPNCEDSVFGRMDWPSPIRQLWIAWQTARRAR